MCQLHSRECQSTNTRSNTGQSNDDASLSLPGQSNDDASLHVSLETMSVLYADQLCQFHITSSQASYTITGNAAQVSYNLSDQVIGDITTISRSHRSTPRL